MRVRSFTPEDYDMLSKWWTSRGWPAIPLSLLPRTGVIVEEKAAGFLYQTDSGMSWMEWIVSDATQENTRPAVIKVVEELTKAAKDMGFSIILCSLVNDKLVGVYEGAGFEVTDKGATNMIRRL